MKEYIEREAFIEAKRKQYCADCDRRKGMKNGKMRFCYEIGEAPCRACYVDDLLTDVEDAPAADVVPVRHGRWIRTDGIAHGIVSRVCSCSLCKRNAGVSENGFWYLSDYCPNCGAKMTEV